MKAVIINLINHFKNSTIRNTLNSVLSCNFLPIILVSLIFFVTSIDAKASQSVSIEAPIVTLNAIDEISIVTIDLDLNQTTISSLTFALTFDKDVLKPIGANILSNGASNLLNEDSIIFGIFNSNGFSTNTQLVEITFEFIGAPGTVSPLNISFINAFDPTGNDISSSAQIINGSIAKTCATNTINGCTNDNYVEFNPTANCDDGSCLTLICQNLNYQKISHFDYPLLSQEISDDGTKILLSGFGTTAIKLFEAQNGTWVQNAADFQPNMTSSTFNLSGAGDKLVFKSFDTSTNPNTNYVQTYFLVNNQWIKPTSDFVSNTTWIKDVVLSKDGNTLIVNHWFSTITVGTPYINDGYIKIYEWVNSSWQQKGSNIDGQFYYPQIAANGNTVLLSDGYWGTVQTKVYNFDGSNWSQLGNDIIGNTPLCHFGDDGNNILQLEYATPWNNPNLTFYEWNGSIWNIKGSSFSVNGSFVNVSGDGTTIGVTDQSDYLDLYKFNGTEWEIVKTFTNINNGFRFWDFKFAKDGSAFIVRGYWYDDDDIHVSAYYANDCHNISNSFCAEINALEGVIDAGLYSSGNVINANGLVNRNSDGDVEMESENTIDLIPGFKATGAVNFEARTAECVPE